ncbi:MAG: hypothetical protein V3U31_07635 [Dehalococcoidia bacterium]
MNGEFPVDVDEVKGHIDRADIFALYFPFLGKTLVVDTRTTADEGPFIRLLPMARSIEERLWKLHKMRSGLPRPRGLVAIPWPRYARSLQELGVWERIVARVGSLGFSGAERDCERALSQLLQVEAKEMQQAISGEGYHSLWESQRLSTGDG